MYHMRDRIWLANRAALGLMHHGVRPLPYRKQGFQSALVPDRPAADKRNMGLYCSGDA